MELEVEAVVVVQRSVGPKCWMTEPASLLHNLGGRDREAAMLVHRVEGRGRVPPTIHKQEEEGDFQRYKG